MLPTNGVATASSTSTDADGAGSGTVRRRPAYLPLHVTEKILCCIRPLESARLATVCKSWAAIVSARLANPVPHLFAFLPPDDRRGFIASVPLDGRSHLQPAPEIHAHVSFADRSRRRCICVTPSGRLAILGYFSPSLSLFNPVTGVSETIDRPWHTWPGRIPVLDDGDLFLCTIYVETFVLGRVAAVKFSELKYLPLRRDAYPINTVLTIVKRNDFFYLLHEGGYLSVIDYRERPLRMEKLPVAGLLADNREGYLLDSDGDILFVLRVLAHKQFACLFCDHGEELDSVIVAFEVYRLEVKEQRWAKVEKLAGDRALFVSPKSSFALRAPETVECMSNCVYFTGMKKKCSSCKTNGVNTWGVYSLEDQKVLFERVFTDSRECTSAMWFLPSVV